MKHLQAFPLDAGTDNGFTFTSPNWATEPRGEVFQMTSTFPEHPAGSFNYPHLARLPTLAVFSLTKVSLSMSAASSASCLFAAKRIHSTETESNHNEDTRKVKRRRKQVPI